MKQNGINQKFQEFTFKSQLAYSTGPPTPGGPGGYVPSPYFFTQQKQKRKKGKQRQKRKSLKAETFKRFHQGQNVTVLPILECLEFKHFSCRPTMVADNAFHCSMTPPL